MLPPSIANHGLFEDYYLQQRLESTLPAEPDLGRILAEVQTLWQAQQGRLAGSEANVSAFVRDVCLRLGLVPSEQSSVRRKGQSTLRIDLTLFGDAATAATFTQRGRTKGETDLYQDALAVMEVEKLGADFDTRKADNSNPSYQIVAYLTYTGRPWGILTDGARWRLYYRFDPPQLDTYLEINLAAILTLPAGPVQQRAFHWFWAFFGPLAFSSGTTQGFLDRVRAASSRYAVEVQENLRRQAFAVVEALAQGLFATAPTTPLPTLYEQAIIILYRLLFVKYAEDREVLPVHNPTYARRYGFSRLQDELLAQLDDPAIQLSPHTPTAWRRLEDFFAAIDHGDPTAGIYGYNGGLFRAGRLVGASVPDFYLAQALDQLARVTATRRRVDYRSLSVRHLGSIYEGLLEKRLAVDGGTVVLVTQAGTRVSARHKSGSYYTPDFVVEYLVKSTLDPLCRDASAAAIAALRVCDPAMGSGHFLVAALDTLAYHHAYARNHEQLTQHPPPGISPEDLEDRAIPTAADQQQSRRLLVERALYGVDLNPLAVELAKLSLWLHTLVPTQALSFLDHQLRCGNSLVGAPQDPAQLDTLPRAAGPPTPLFTHIFVQQVQAVVQELPALQALPGNTAAEVSVKAQRYAAVEATLDRVRQVANAWVAAARGHAMPPALYGTILSYLTAPDAAWAQVTGAAEWVAAQQIASDESFFHWGLAFPEVFYPSTGAGGFQAVISNPPYVRQEYQTPAEKTYLAAAYPQVHHNSADLYSYFIGQGAHLLAPAGRLAYIVSNSWLRAKYGTPLRRFLRTVVTLEEVVDLGDNGVFADAPDVYPALLRLRQAPPAPDGQAQAAVFRRNTLDPAHFAAQMQAGRFTLAVHDQPDSGWQLSGSSVRDLFAKIMAQGRPLADLVAGQMYRGLLTGLNEAFIIDQATRDRLVVADPQSAALLKPILGGEDLRPWYQENEGWWLILLPDGWTTATFGAGLDEATAWQQFSGRHPALAAYLVPYAAAARQRQDKGHYWWELRSCDYYNAFEQSKIFWPDIGKFPRFSYDTTGYYLTNTGYILPTAEGWLLGYLASRCAWFALSQIAVGLGERAGLPRYRLTDQYMRQLPVPHPDAPTRAKLEALAQDLTTQARARHLLHRDTQQRIYEDLGGKRRPLNQKLTAWWDLADLAALRAEAKKAFRLDIPLAERTAWGQYLTDQQAAHLRLTANIVRLETDLNTAVYGLFGLTTAEQTLIEQHTQYRYGEE